MTPSNVLSLVQQAEKWTLDEIITLLRERNIRGRLFMYDCCPLTKLLQSMVPGPWWTGMDKFGYDSFMFPMGPGMKEFRRAFDDGRYPEFQTLVRT